MTAPATQGHAGSAAARGGPDLPPPEAARRPALRWPWQVSVGLAFLAVWQFGVSSGLLSRRSFAEPATVLRWFVEWHASGESIPHVTATLSAGAVGYVCGVLLGAAVATTFAAVPFIERVLDPFMALINGIPKVVLAPFLVLVFGLGMTSKVAVAALLVFFVSFFNFSGGLKSVNRSLIDNVRVLGGSRLGTARHLYLPAMVSWTMTTLRLGLAFALIGVVVGEFVGSTEGIGWNIKLAGELSQPDRLLGSLLTLAVVAAVIDRGFVSIERRFSRWRVA